MDGTLTVPNLDFARMYERCGVPMSKDLLAEISTMPPAQAADALGVIAEMEAEGRRTLELIPGAVELARWLGARGVRTALVTRNSSSTVQHFQRVLWEPAGLPPLFPALSREDEVGPPKPDPAALRYIASQWDVPLDAGLVMVGDSPKNDIAFGKAAGLATALLDTGRRYVDGDDGTDGGADFVVSSLAGLPALLERTYRTQLLTVPPPPLDRHETPVASEGAAPAAAAGDTRALSAMPAHALHAVDSTGNTPLIWAANEGRVDAIRLLIDAGVDLNVSGYLGATALNRAARSGHSDAVRLLLSAGASPEIPNVKWQYPMHFAAYKRNPEAVRLLLEHGASTTVIDRKSRTPDGDTKDVEIRAQILAARAARVTRGSTIVGGAP
jgi:phosphoglycolate phosphatase-like HAD superfamily hydrolase